MDTNNNECPFCGHVYEICCCVELTPAERIAEHTGNTEFLDLQVKARKQRWIAQSSARDGRVW